MTNGVSSVLKVIQRDLLGLKHQVDLTSGGFNRMKLAAIGFGTVLGGAAVLGVMERLVKAGDKLVEQQTKLKGLGVSAANVGAATGAAVSMAQTIPGTDPAHNLQMIRELRGVLKNTQEAIAAAPEVLKAELVMQQYGAAGSDGAMLNILKAMDIKGSFVKNGQLDVGALQNAIHTAETALTLTNGLLTPNMFYRFTRMAGPAATAMNTTQYLKDFTEVMMGLGSTGGRGMQMAAKTFLGGQVTKANVQQLEALGLLSDKDILKDHGHYAIKTGTLKGYQELLSKGFAQWFKDVVVPAMAAHGFHGDAAVLQALSSLPVTEQRLFSFLYTNSAQVEKFGAQFDKASGTDQFKVLQNGSMALNIKDISAAWDGLMQALGAPLVKPAISILHGLTDAILYLQKEAFKHPEMVKDIGEVATVIGALAIAGGTIAIGTAAFAAISAIAGPAGLIALIGGAAVGATKGLQELLDVLHHLAPWAFADAGKTNTLGQIQKHGVQVPWWWPLPAGPGGRANAPDLNLNHYLPGHSRGADGSYHNQSYLPPPSSAPLIHLESDIYLDGNRIAKVVSAHQARALSLPSPGRTDFDGRMTPSYPQNLVSA